MASPYYDPYQDPNYIQQQANALGITPAQYSQLAGQDVGVVGSTGGHPGMEGSGFYGDTGYPVYGVQQGSALDTLSQLKSAGINLGGGQQQNQPPGLINPTLAMQHPSSILGAQALQAIGLNPTGTVAINATPAQTPGGSKAFLKSGVSPVSGPQYYNLSGQQVPSQVQALGQGAASVYQPAYTPTQATTPPPAPTPQAFAAGTGSATPFAQAPPAPSINIPPVPSAPFAGGGAPGQNSLFGAHTAALADAGKAIYAHYGGDPGSATPADIAGFHSELQGALAGGPPIKRRSGGPVPGRGNTDTVPAMLTPGEYVLNKGAVDRIGVGNLQQMNRAQHFQSGGSVDDDEPAEARRKSITTGSTQPPSAPSDNQPIPSQPTAPSQSAPGTSAGPAWQNYQALAAMNARAGYLPYNAATMPGVPAYGPFQNPNAGLPAGTSGYVTESGQAIAPTPGTAGTLSPAGASALSSGISGLASGLSAAAQKYADSIGSWKMQPSAIGRFGSPVAQSGPAATFSQPQTQNPQNQSNPSDQFYRLRMMGLV